MFENYFKGIFAAYLGSAYICGPVSEWRIDMIKESISRYNEAQIDHSWLSVHEKEEQNHQMRQSLDVYIQGVKDMLSGEGRLVRG